VPGTSSPLPTSQVDAQLVGSVVRAPKTAELIAGQLRRQVVRGELVPGDTLPPEQQLMAQFGVSRPTLREAFRILETENLITVRRGSRGGAKVTQPSVSVAARYVGLLLQIQGATIGDVYNARLVLEPACAGLLAKHRTAADLVTLRESIEHLRAIVDAGPAKVPDLTKWSGGTARFHELISQLSGNKTLAVQCGVLQEIVETHLAQTVARTFDQDSSTVHFPKAIRSYEKLVSLVEARDAAGAERHWRSHMDAAAKGLRLDDTHNQSVVDLFS
jgi:DNA-binding FadR family transcriptional regulator